MFVTIVFSIVITVCGTTVSGSDNTECVFSKIEDSGFPSFYSIGDVNVPTLSRTFYVEPSQNSTTCYINSPKVIGMYQFPLDQTITGFFKFICASPIQILFKATELQGTLNNVIGYLYIENCAIAEYNTRTFLNLLDTRVLALTNCIFEDKDTNISNTNGSSLLLNHVGSFAVDDPVSKNDSFVHKILTQKPKFPLVREALFSNLGWQFLPEYVKTHLPRLESLDIHSNGLNFPPSDFPWTPFYENLPLNLSRSSWFQNRYSQKDFLKIDPHIYRRVFNLGFNKIRDLSNFTFHGSLHMIMLEGNGLKEIGEECFSVVNDLQHLRLNNNNLTEIPSNLFRSLSDLRFLDISNNFLTHIHNNTFDSLKQLQVLNLAYNRITRLPLNAFSELKNLVKLNLEGNDINQFGPDVLPLYNVHLQEVNLNHNPLSNMPISLFYVVNLKMSDLKNTQIKLQFRNFLNRINVNLIQDSTITTPKKEEKVVDLTGSNVTRVDIPDLTDSGGLHKLALLLSKFQFILDNNPLNCDCNLLKFKEFVSIFTSNGVFKGNEYFRKSWICKFPVELSGRALMDVKADETYCEQAMANCPDVCHCYKRSVSDNVIVDCQNSNLKSLPVMLPDGILELWFQHNNITSIEPRTYFRRTKTINIESNSVVSIQENVLNSMHMLESLQLHQNYIVSLPKEFTELPLISTTLSDNPLSCDCKSVWLKTWVTLNKDKVSDWDRITCNTQSNKGRKLVDTPESEFVCKEFPTPSLGAHIIVAVSGALFVLFMVVCLLCVYRLEVKVLLYFYFGVHVCDKRFHELAEEIDVSVVYPLEMTGWVETNIVNYLQEHSKTTLICDFHREAIAGFSIQDNITCIIQRSKRIVVVLTQDFIESSLLSMTWTEAQKKIRDARTDFVIVVSHELACKTIDNVELRKYVKRGCSIGTHDRLFHKKLVYHVSLSHNSLDKFHRHRKNQNNTLPEIRQAIRDMYSGNSTPYIGQDHNHPVLFVSYGEKSFSLVKDDIIPKLEKEDFTLEIPDRDFTPGAAKEENILAAIEKSEHTLFIVSVECLQDEWSLFTFRSAYQKSIREKTNHLIFILTQNGNMDAIQDEEIRQYIKYHVTLCIEDNMFWENFMNSLEKPVVVTNTDSVEHFNNLNRDSNGIDNSGFSTDSVAINILEYNISFNVDAAVTFESNHNECLTENVETLNHL